MQSQKDEFLEMSLDEADPSQVVLAFVSDEMQRTVVDFLKQNMSTFAWTTADMKGIDPAITAHELNVVGTKIRTVDFRLNKETRKILIFQRSRISANTTRQAIRTQ